MNEITVTVICLAYNHEAWIRDALDGFVSQEAPFGIEVLVHDDASTDGTADIIRDYAARYPDRIHPVLERENQFSRGIAIGPRLLAPLIHGRYVALKLLENDSVTHKELSKYSNYKKIKQTCLTN